MTQSIPASSIVSSVPGVLAAGGNPLSLNAVFLTEDSSIPIGVAQSFPDLSAVQNWFGANSPEAQLAGFYFGGFNNANSLPNALYFYQYNAVAVAGYMRGGALTGVTLANIQALAGTLTVTIDGRVVTSANVNLAAATSFTNAAAIIQTALQTLGGIFNGTGSVAIGSPTLTITAVTSGTLHVGDPVVGVDIPPGTTIQALGTGTGGVGTYTMSANATATAGPEPITVSSTATVTYDQLRNAFVITSATNGVTSSVGFATADALTTGLLLTATTGAVLSAGAAAASPASSMNGVVASTQNWATFTHVFDPDNGAAGGPIKLAFSAWTSQNSPAGNERFAYAAWDTDDTPASNGADAACFAAQVKALGYNGTVPIWEPGDIQVAGAKAAFFCGAVASLDFTETQGRITFAFKSAAGLLADVTDATTAANLQANGYNYYGSWATANQDFTFFYPGSMPGAWKWADAYINQIAMNADFQLALMVYMTAVKTIPYVQIGYGGLRAALQDPISKYLNFGAIQAGVTLSASQIQQVNTAAGTPIDQVLASAGYYLQIKAASAQTRGNRQSPPMTFWYTDGGSVQQISMASIDVQ